MSRSSLTRGSSQEDPQQLMRDLADSMEREADIREQLKFAEEEAESLRKKVLRIEDENESLMVQLKKMATKARSECETFFWRFELDSRIGNGNFVHKHVNGCKLNRYSGQIALDIVLFMFFFSSKIFIYF